MGGVILPFGYGLYLLMSSGYYNMHSVIVPGLMILDYHNSMRVLETICFNHKQ
jgi:hypothetical protein